MDFTKDIEAIFKEFLIYSKTDLNGIIVEVSKEFESISGYTAEELIGQPHSIVRHPEMEKDIFKEMWETIQKDEVWSGFVQNRNKNGSSYYVMSYVLPYYENNEKKGYISYRESTLEHLLYKKTFFDKSQKREGKIDESRGVCSNRIDMTILTDGKRVKNINGCALKLMGFNTFNEFVQSGECMCDHLCYPEELEGTQYKKEDFLLKVDYPEDVSWVTGVESKMYAAMKTPRGIEYFSPQIDYTFKGITQVSFYNITQEISKDLTNTKSLEKSTNLLKKQEKMVVMGDMLHNIAHQWRQPLGVISSLVSSIQFDIDNDMVENEELKENVDLILEQSHYLSKTIDTFRNYLKSNNEIQELDLVDITKEAISLVTPNYTKNNIKISLDVEGVEEVYKLYGVAEQLTQVFINMLNNAKDAFIEQEDQNNREVKIEIFKIEDENKVGMHFIDNAGGIPTYIIDSIFEPYVSTKGQNGTGIGLSMSYDIITKSFFGSVEVHNSEEGAVFTIKLPM